MLKTNNSKRWGVVSLAGGVCCGTKRVKSICIVPYNKTSSLQTWHVNGLFTPPTRTRQDSFVSSVSTV